jgi:hypothetical protein
MNQEAQSVEQEDVPNEAPIQFIQPKIIPPRVLLEILIEGNYEENTDPKESEAYKKALELQQQIDSLRGKDKFKVRILWKVYDGHENQVKSQETKEWLVENSSCKYYCFAAELLYINIDYVKNLLKTIKNFESSIESFKNNQIQFKKKSV